MPAVSERVSTQRRKTGRREAKAHMAKQRSEGVRDSVQQLATMMLAAPRTILVVALGTIVVVGHALQSTANRLTDEGERQLARLNGSLERAGAAVWPPKPESATTTRARDRASESSPASALREQARRTPPSDEPAIEIQQSNDAPGS